MLVLVSFRLNHLEKLDNDYDRNIISQNNLFNLNNLNLIKNSNSNLIKNDNSNLIN